MSRISVIIPTFNRSSLLCEAIESVLPQVSKHDEIIVVDDGSTDGTREAICKFGEHVRYIWQKNAFLAMARNRGLRASRGKYLLFLDSDDLLLESAIPRLYEQLERNIDAPLAYGVAIAFGSDGPCQLEPLDDAGSEREPLRLSKANFIRTSGCALIRRSAICAVGRWDPKLRGIEDWDMWLRLSMLGNFAREENDVLRYRVHPSNMSQNHEMMNRSVRRLVVKYSSIFSCIRRDREAWAHFRSLRPNAMRDEIRYQVSRYKGGNSAIGELALSCLEYVCTVQGARRVCRNLARRLHISLPQ